MKKWGIKRFITVFLLGVMLTSFVGCDNKSHATKDLKISENSSHGSQVTSPNEDSSTSFPAKESISGNLDTLNDSSAEDSMSNQEATSSTEQGADISTAVELVDGMRPQFKEAMDSYETYYDVYCDFMKRYKENPTDLNLIAEYSDMVSQLTEMNEKLEAWNEDEMNAAELEYYLAVSSRITQKLLEVAQ